MFELDISTSMDASNIRKTAKEIEQEEKKLRREASRLASMANKRLRRLEEQDLTNTPAYKSWFENGGVKFGVKGKTKREVQHEMARLERFLKMRTSTVRGAKKNLETVANRINIYNWENYKDLEKQISDYFSLQQKVLEYSSNIKEIGVSLNYEKVGEYVADYLRETDGAIAGTGEEVIEVTKKIVESVGKDKTSKELEKLANELERILNN